MSHTVNLLRIVVGMQTVGTLHKYQRICNVYNVPLARKLCVRYFITPYLHDTIMSLYNQIYNMFVYVPIHKTAMMTILYKT